MNKRKPSTEIRIMSVEEFTGLLSTCEKEKAVVNILQEGVPSNLTMTLIGVQSRTKERYNLSFGDDYIVFFNEEEGAGCSIDLYEDHIETNLLVGQCYSKSNECSRHWLNSDGTGVKYPDDVDGVRSAFSFEPEMSAEQFVELLMRLYPLRLDYLRAIDFKPTLVA